MITDPKIRSALVILQHIGHIRSFTSVGDYAVLFEQAHVNQYPADWTTLVSLQLMCDFRIHLGSCSFVRIYFMKMAFALSLSDFFPTIGSSLDLW